MNIGVSLPKARKKILLNRLAISEWGALLAPPVRRLADGWQKETPIKGGVDP